MKLALLLVCIIGTVVNMDGCKTDDILSQALDLVEETKDKGNIITQSTYLYEVFLVESAVVRAACPMFCTADYSPVCGSDGVTYSNKCGLIVAACLKKAEGVIIHEAHKGQC